MSNLELPDLFSNMPDFWNYVKTTPDLREPIMLQLTAHTAQVFECRRLPWQAIGMCINHCFPVDPTDPERFTNHTTINLTVRDTQTVHDAWQKMKIAQARNMGAQGLLVTTNAPLVFTFLVALHLLLDRLSQAEPMNVPPVYFALSERDRSTILTLAVLLDSGSVELQNSRLRVSNLMNILDFYASQRFIGGYLNTEER